MSNKRKDTKMQGVEIKCLTYKTSESDKVYI